MKFDIGRSGNYIDRAEENMKPPILMTKRWGSLTHDEQELATYTSQLARKLREFVKGFKSDPGTSDLDREQPIHSCVKLGVWRDAGYLLSLIDRERDA